MRSPVCTRGHIRAIHYCDDCMCVCVRTATHTQVLSADGICRYGRCLSFCFRLSLSVLAERRAKVEREKFRAFRETDFIRAARPRVDARSGHAF